MFKYIYCAAATLIGAMIGANAPADWRGDASRVARTAALADDIQTADLAMVYRPYQKGD